MTDTFKCVACRGTFNKGWSDEEAIAEHQEHFPEVPLEETDLVCDDCYQLLINPANLALFEATLGPNEQKYKRR